MIMMILDVERIDDKRWYYFLEKKYASEKDEKKIL
jgi:hypothetical protein